MKIKRYTAPSMRAALALVRSEQGPDAVILSSRRSDEGIEVIAAVDYDEALFVDATRQRQALPAAAAPAGTTAKPAPQTAAASVPRVRAPAPPASVPAPPVPMQTRPALLRMPPIDPVYGAAMQREIQDLRRLLETGLAGMTWSDKRLRDPLQAHVLEELSAMDISPDVAMALATLTPRGTTSQNPSHLSMALLCRHLPMVNDLTSVTGGITAVVGPTGAGKTTTIAKLAARWCMSHGCQDMALVSTDGYRIGAREQLSTYARILGVPMYAANSGKELGRVLERLGSKKLILIDTAGMGPRDVRLTEHLSALRLGAARATVLLALPAQGEGHALDEIVRAFARANPCGCIITKVDEAASLGAVISASLRHTLKIAYVCNGQKVPQDLHAAQQKRVWLVHAALEMKARAVPRRDQAYLARHFGRVPAHA